MGSHDGQVFFNFQTDALKHAQFFKQFPFKTNTRSSVAMRLFAFLFVSQC